MLSHGDFHPKNIYLGADQSVTVIDLETVALRDAEADVGYFLGQIAGMGQLQFGTFRAILDARRCFLQACQELRCTFSQERTAVYLTIWFVENLHYQLCAMHNGKDELRDCWLQTVENCLRRGELLNLRELC